MTSAWVRRAISLVIVACACAFVLLASRPAHAFPWMIREGYTGCNTCHADPSGAGILTAYGRGMEEVVLRTPYKKDADPGKLGNFAWSVDLPEQLLLQTDFRNLFLTLVPSGGTTQFQDVVMQLDQSAQLKIGRFRMNGSIGYSPPSTADGNFTFTGGGLGATLTDAPGVDGALIARQYWLGVDIGKDEEFLLRAGRMNVPFGIRTIEHPFLVRQVTRTDIDKGQEHGVSLAYTGEKVRGEIMAIAGNFAIRPDDFRERGGSGFVEWMPSTKVAIGASAMITHADQARTDYDISLAAAPIWRHAYAVHARISPVKPLVILAEFDALLNSQLVAGVSENHGGVVGLLQADLQVYQGIHVLAAGEFYNGHVGETSTYNTTTATAWLGAWWFFAPHLDFRIDGVYSSGSAPGLPPSNQGTSLLAQIHGYL
ncbi:MAG TPA: hypothetical protein VGH28_04670 [Polyangiaceae bacterium]|jgi:hypothetical protein